MLSEHTAQCKWHFSYSYSLLRKKKSIQPIIILMKKAHQQEFGKNVCIYSCKKKSKYSAAKRTLCLKKLISKSSACCRSGLTTQTPWTEGWTSDSEGQKRSERICPAPDQEMPSKTCSNTSSVVSYFSSGWKAKPGLWGERAAASGRAYRGTKCKHMYTAWWSQG